MTEYHFESPKGLPCPYWSKDRDGTHVAASCACKKHCQDVSFLENRPDSGKPAPTARASQDRITRVTNALYAFEWGEAGKQGLVPVDYEATINFMRLKAEAMLRAADGTTDPVADERERCAIIALEQRCERKTDWDRACVAVADAIRAGPPGSPRAL